MLGNRKAGFVSASPSPAKDPTARAAGHWHASVCMGRAQGTARRTVCPRLSVTWGRGPTAPPSLRVRHRLPPACPHPMTGQSGDPQWPWCWPSESGLVGSTPTPGDLPQALGSRICSSWTPDSCLHPLRGPRTPPPEHISAA